MYLLASVLRPRRGTAHPGAPGWAGENNSLFEHPASCSDPIRDLVQSCVFGDTKWFVNSLLDIPSRLVVKDQIVAKQK